MTYASPTTATAAPTSATSAIKILAVKASIKITTKELKAWLKAKSVKRIKDDSELVNNLAAGLAFLAELNDQPEEIYSFYQVDGCDSEYLLSVKHPEFGHKLTVNDDILDQLVSSLGFIFLHASLSALHQQHAGLSVFLGATMKHAGIPPVDTSGVNAALEQLRYDYDTQFGNQCRATLKALLADSW